MLFDRSNCSPNGELFYSFFSFFLRTLECLRSTKDGSQVFIYIPQTSSISGFSLTEEKQFPYKNEAS